MQTLAVWRHLHNARPFSRTAGPRVTGCLLATFPLLELRLPFQLEPSPSGTAFKRNFGGLLSAPRAPESRLWEVTTSHRTEPPSARCGGGQVRVCRGGEPTAGQTDSGVPSRAAAGGAPPGRCRRKALGAVPGPALSGRRGSAAGSRGSAPGGGSGPGAASSARLGSGPGGGKEGDGDGGGPGARRLAAGAGSASWRRRGAGAGVGGQGRAGPPAAGCARLPLMTVILRAMLQRGRECGAARARVYNAPGAPSAPRS